MKNEISEQQYEEIISLKDNLVSWKVFTWAIGLLGLVIGWTFLAQANQSTKVDLQDEKVEKFDKELAIIETKLDYITKQIDLIQFKIDKSQLTRKQ
jgi:peptidoglycan hydrolase CwlO-like protein